MASIIWLNSEGNILINDSREILLCNECPCEDVTPDPNRYVTIDNFLCCDESIFTVFPRILYVHFSPAYCGVTTVRVDFTGTFPGPSGSTIVVWESSIFSSNSGTTSKIILSAFSQQFPDAFVQCSFRIDYYNNPSNPPVAVFAPLRPAVSPGEEWDCDAVGIAPMPVIGGPFVPLDCVTALPVPSSINIIIDENP